MSTEGDEAFLSEVDCVGDVDKWLRTALVKSLVSRIKIHEKQVGITVLSTFLLQSNQGRE